MPKTTRQVTKDQIESMIERLKYIEQLAIKIGMLYQDSDSSVSPCMYLISELVETAIPLLEQTNKEL